MTDPTGLSFTKMQGTGNDFLVLDNWAHKFSAEELSELAATWCPRRFGVGADGLLALDRPESPDADYRMRYFNADGSRATMCGNGARCLYRFAREHGFAQQELAFDTDAGLYRATVRGDGFDQIRLYVPDVTDVRDRVQLERAVPDPITALYYVHAGTEHLVALVDDLEAVPVDEWGPHLRYDPALEPAGANVNFAVVDSKGTVDLRTYEKGVEGETLSCGTGVLAAAVVAERRHGRASPDSRRVRTKGGELRVGRAQTTRGSERYLEGPAVSVFKGTVPRSPGT